MELGTLIAKVNNYKNVLENTTNYRVEWGRTVKPMLIKSLEEISKELNIAKAEVIVRDNIENLEAILFDLGKSTSGISENVEDSGVKRTMIKSNGALIYQQLFNGKIIVMVVSPNIEGYGQPKPPTTIEVLRPEELKSPFIIRHMEILLKEITEWEDYDDNEQKSTIGFTPNPIGFTGNDQQNEGDSIITQ
jgi:hypothetical protein